VRRPNRRKRREPASGGGSPRRSLSSFRQRARQPGWTMVTRHGKERRCAGPASPFSCARIEIVTPLPSPRGGVTIGFAYPYVLVLILVLEISSGRTGCPRSNGRSDEPRPPGDRLDGVSPSRGTSTMGDYDDDDDYDDDAYALSPRSGNCRNPGAHQELCTCLTKRRRAACAALRVSWEGGKLSARHPHACDYSYPHHLLSPHVVYHSSLAL